MNTTDEESVWAKVTDPCHPTASQVANTCHESYVARHGAERCERARREVAACAQGGAL